MIRFIGVPGYYAEACGQRTALLAHSDPQRYEDWLCTFYRLCLEGWPHCGFSDPSPLLPFAGVLNRFWQRQSCSCRNVVRPWHPRLCLWRLIDKFRSMIFFSGLRYFLIIYMQNTTVFSFLKSLLAVLPWHLFYLVSNHLSKELSDYIRFKSFYSRPFSVSFNLPIRTPSLAMPVPLADESY